MFRELLLVAASQLKALSRVPFSSEWEQIYAEASRQGLIGLIWSAICALPVEQQPTGQLRERWSREVESLAIVGDVYDSACKRITQWFDARGIQSCILKGRAYAAMYPEDAPRLTGDIDIWVDAPRKDVLSAFYVSGIRYSDVLWQECKVSFFPDIILDVHYHPLRLYNPVFNRRFVKICRFEASYGFKEGDKGFGVPSGRFSAVFCVAHLFLHFVGGGVGLRQLADLYYLLRELGPDGRAWAFGCLCYIGLADFTAASMHALRYAFGIEESLLLCEPDPKRGADLLESIRLSGGNLAKPDMGGRVNNSLHHTKCSLRFVFSYPNQLLWVPLYKIWHFCWRGVHRFTK